MQTRPLLGPCLIGKSRLLFSLLSSVVSIRYMPNRSRTHALSSLWIRHRSCPRRKCAHGPGFPERERRLRRRTVDLKREPTILTRPRGGVLFSEPGASSLRRLVLRFCSLTSLRAALFNSRIALLRRLFCTTSMIETAAEVSTAMITISIDGLFIIEWFLFQDSPASPARRVRVDLSLPCKDNQHLPNRTRANPRGAFILISHRGAPLPGGILQHSHIGESREGIMLPDGFPSPYSASCPSQGCHPLPAGPAATADTRFCE